MPQTTIERTADQSTLPRALKIVVGLLWFSAFINYVDRGNLSIAAPLLKDELGLSASQLGILLSAFFWTYSSFQLIAGWAVDRFDVSVVMAVGFFIWSAATATTGLMHGFIALLVMRLVLGVGESVAYPSYSKILASHCPEERKGIANAVLASGLSLGPAFGIFVGGILIGRLGWREYFIVLGLASMLWLVPWWRFKLKPIAANSTAKLSYREILKAAVRLGNVRRPFLRQLYDVLFADVAAVLSGAGTAFFDGADGANRRTGIHFDGDDGADFGMGRGQIHGGGKIGDAGTKRIFDFGDGWRGRFPDVVGDGEPTVFD